jgi:hypothetical protein
MIFHKITEADRKKTLENIYLHTLFSVYRQFFTCIICKKLKIVLKLFEMNNVDE